MSLPSDSWFNADRRAHYLNHSHGVTAAYAAAFESRWRGPGHWLLSPTGPLQRAAPADLNGRNRQEVADALLRAGGQRSSDYDVLVKLSLGVRNRVCHHESLLGLTATHWRRLDQLCGLLLPGYQVRFRRDSRVLALLRRRPR